MSAMQKQMHRAWRDGGVRLCRKGFRWRRVSEHYVSSSRSTKVCDDNVSVLTHAAFSPADGARGFQVSSPSILDITALTAALTMFAKSDMHTIASRSRQLTSYLEAVLDDLARSLANGPTKNAHVWTLVTPRDMEQRGAMLSYRWHDIPMLDRVLQRLKNAYVIVDIRKPDIMRVTPSPLYTSFGDVWKFAEELDNALKPDMT
jgi:kynureninase